MGGLSGQRRTGRRFIIFTLFCAGGTLLAGVALTAILAPYSNPFVFGFGATLVLALGLYIWVKGVRTTPPPPAKTSHPPVASLEKTQETLFALNDRIDAILKSPWLSGDDLSNVKLRLRAVLQSWREDMMSDLPAFTDRLLRHHIQRFLKNADGVIGMLEMLTEMDSDDKHAIEDVEERVLNLLSHLQELVDDQEEEGAVRA